MTQYSLVIDKLAFERDDVLLFSELSAIVTSGQVVQLVGANGAGKTTLMKLIAGLLLPSQGHITWIDGDDVSDNRGYPFFSQLLYLGHDTGVNLSLTAMENLRWYFGINGCKGNVHTTALVPTDEQLQQALAQVGLTGYEDCFAREMSAGQRRRVALARLYCSQAVLWVLDEPFTAIDVVGVARLESLIETHVARGGAVLLTTHQATKIADIKILDVETFKASRLSVEAQ